MEDYLALIPAAGMGSRAQQNMAKQFQKIGAKCLIEYSIAVSYTHLTLPTTSPV